MRTPPYTTDGQPIQLPQQEDHQSPQPERPQHQSMKQLPNDGKTGWTADPTLRPTGRGQNVVPQCQLAGLTRWLHADMCRCAVHVGMQGDDATVLRCANCCCALTHHRYTRTFQNFIRACSKTALACRPLPRCTQCFRVVHAHCNNPVARS